MSSRTCVRWIAALLVLGGAALNALMAGPGDTLRMSQNVPGDSNPILLTADDIQTWVEGRQRIFLFKGRVLIEHGVVHARMQQAVAWVDLDRSKRTGITRMDVYGEGDVGLENGTDAKSGAKVLCDLNTRGEVKFKGKVLQQVAKDDPLYKRALTETAAKPQAPAASPIQRTSYQVQGNELPAGPPTPAQPVPQQAPPQWVIPGQSPPGVPPAGVVAPPYPPPPQQSPPPAPPPAPLPDPQPQQPAPRQEAPPAPPAGAPVATVPPLPLVPPPERRGPPRQITMMPRGTDVFNIQTIPLPNGETAYSIANGLQVLVTNPTDRVAILDMEADRAIVWVKGNIADVFNNMRKPGGATTNEVEFYLAGNVELRTQDAKQSHTLRADEMYYDVSRNVAVAYQADLEFNYVPNATSKLRLADPVHVRADELLQISPTLFEMHKAGVAASRLPSDPGLEIYVSKGQVESRQIQKRTWFGFGPPALDPVTGQEITETQRIFKGTNVLPKLEGIPFFYLPYIQGDVNDPLGPLESVNVNYNKMFGTQIFTTWNVYDLIGVTPPPMNRWLLNVDFMSKRGPALGTSYDYAGADFFGMPSKYVGYMKAYGMYDKGWDLLGMNRGGFEQHPLYRGRVFWQHQQDFPDDFYFQGRVSALSDRNFLEEYYYNEFATAPNQETFGYLKQQRDNWAWTFWTEGRIRNWVNETQRLPQVDGYLLGESFPFLGDLIGNRFTYNAHASAGYLRLMTTHVTPPPVGLTTDAVNTGRFDLWQDLSLPFSLGDVRLEPYAVIDLTQYTRDLYGDSVGRFYGGGGLRGSVPLSRLFPDVQSELLNLNGIYHKIVLSGNYYNVHSDVPFTTLPQLDRLNDDATDKSLMDQKPEEPLFQPNPKGIALATSTLYDPQVYAIRKLQLFNRTDTLDTIQELQVDLRQRWQTKRGYPGAQHIIDWMVLDLQGSFFPDPARSNFNNAFGLLQWNWLWNIGDRTALVSDGWEDPMAGGARTWSVGAYFNRPDRTNFYLGYRDIYPINSQLLTGAVSYVFSPKYAMTASSAYDFGLNQGLSNALMFTRMGKDLQVSMGVTYNAILNNFGFLFEILPNAAAQSGRHAAFGSSMLAR